ncbi:MAG: hypothetical protein E3J86_06960, partial [Candidatus Thorarchaeota archaeon]
MNRKLKATRTLLILVLLFLMLSMPLSFVNATDTDIGEQTTTQSVSSTPDLLTTYSGKLGIVDTGQMPLSVQATIDRFAQTNWNAGDIDVTEPVVLPPDYMYQGEYGDVLYSSECDNFDGWEFENPGFSGEKPITEIHWAYQAPITVDNSRYKCASIPTSTSYLHGPLMTHAVPLGAGVTLQDGLDLTVKFQQQYVYGHMSDVGVVIYDSNLEIMFKAWVHDAWYGSRTDVYAGYYPIGTGSYYQKVQKSSSWNGDVRIWYDRDTDRIKADILGTQVTLLQNPSDAELARNAWDIGVYFARNKDWHYDSKYLDSIDLTVAITPDRSWPARPQSPALDGHWFPQTSYSRLYFKVNQPYADSKFRIWMVIEADQDPIERYLTVRVDGSQIYHERIHPNTGFNDYMEVYGSGVKKIELQINYGGYKDKGWKLKYFYPERTNGEPLEIIGEYFPETSSPELTYHARMGMETKLNIKVENDQDTNQRSFYVYVDGQYKGTGSIPGSHEFSLGDYTHDSLHEISLVMSGSTTQWGKIVSIKRVHHWTAGVEIDYMSGHSPSQADLDQLEAYYITLGPHRVEFELDDLIPYQTYFDPATNGYPNQDYWDLSNSYRDHNEAKWEWANWVHYLRWDGSDE